MQEIKVIELFAGVGGFRIGLEKASSKYKVVWSNQWEPSTKKQEASDIYVKRFGKKNHSNEDIVPVPSSKIPKHNMLVGGFPCQDYSVARTLNQAAGLKGKKGVLWWSIERIMRDHSPELALLENVDRLLKSPIAQRGRDFAIMLASLADLGYAVEWRVINAADYGMPQRRRRIFILAYRKGTPIYKALTGTREPIEWVKSKGVLAETFPIKTLTQHNRFDLKGDLPDISENFNNSYNAKSLFSNSGVMIDRTVYTIESKPDYHGQFVTLGDILSEEPVDEKYYIEDNLDKWRYLKGSKKEERVNKSTGFKYHYGEGSMVFPDALDRASRTIITAEGGASPSRFKHVIETADGRLRRLTPVELERLNMFPDGHTEGTTDIKRAFFMGNALVVGIVEKIGTTLAERLDERRGTETSIRQDRPARHRAVCEAVTGQVPA